MSYKPVVKVKGDPKWYDNALRFETYKEAGNSAMDLMTRWLMVVEWGVEESSDPVNYKYINGGLVEVKEAS
jgi:hypothetical protein